MPIDDRGQLPLGLRWPSRQRFEHFVAGDNGLALSACQRAASEAAAPWLFLAGPPGSGKSHLLLATCQRAAQAGPGAQYLPLRDLPAPLAPLIRGAGGRALVALDDLDAIAGDGEAEHAVFDLYNRSRADGVTLLFAAGEPPSSLPLVLPDLRSRLGLCTQLALRPLDEAARRDWLRGSAAARGIVLDDEVIDWLFRRHARDLGSLAALLERLDRASLASRRRVTIPFLRTLLG
ncbi:MAG TPA: DnaA regulatory inactivator Hda [Rhodanobacteraceae bacterium]|nr:DnaA regulatory inactivator Hda [Rhodanobacteraceae bacterium]